MSYALSPALIRAIDEHRQCHAAWREASAALRRDVDTHGENVAERKRVADLRIRLQVLEITAESLFRREFLGESA